MYQLPSSTAINKPLYKKAVFEKFNLKKAEQERFDADISRTILVARISAATVPALADDDNTKGFYVMQVILKHKEYNELNILLLHKLIPQQIVFALQYDDQTQLCIYHTRLLKAEWQASADTAILLQGLTIADAWQHIVANIGALDANAEHSIEQQIINREQQEKLERQIDSLEKKCRTEKQTLKQYQIYQQILFEG
ncbi:MAG: DUF4391 domain-containing protein, partial [Bacteroidales bacterium]|nr:DUF4391 domain-containing protein [Bacteroidales bacterium]